MTAKQKITVVGKNNFPAILKEIHDPPEQLYVWGEIPDMPMLAVVGTRKASPYGKQITPRLVQKLSRAGLCIISGLAYGIDALAHETALEAGGTTVAVLGSGLDRKSLYPRDHWRLAERIVERGGAVISEYPEGTTPERFHFSARHPIVAGMSRGVLVVEAPEKSGALITADLAMQYDRDVFCIPGPITSPNSSGTNHLIQLGAKLVMNADDILEEFGIVPVAKNETEITALSETHQKILTFLGEGQKHVDEILVGTGLDITMCNVGLMELELSGFVKNLGGGSYAKI